VANFDPGNVSVLLGDGDGTFKTAVNLCSGTDGSFLDCSGRLQWGRRLDFAVADAINVSILLGGGDGTFEAVANYAAGTNTRSVAVWRLQR